MIINVFFHRQRSLKRKLRKPDWINIVKFVYYIVKIFKIINEILKTFQ